MTRNVGNNCVEPMFAGIPVIGTSAGAAGYLIQDYVTGIRVAYGKAEQIAKATRFLLSDRADCRRMGQRAQAFARAIFSHSDVCEAHVRLYLHQLGQFPSQPAL